MKKIVSILFVALFTTLVFAVSYKNNTYQKLADEYTKKAEMALDAGEYDLAIEYSAKASCDILREVIKNNGKVNKEEILSKKKKMIKLICQLCIVVIAVVFIVVGVFNGGADDTLQKAVNICTECIGLG